MNTKIPTGVGTVILVIISITAFFFVWKFSFNGEYRQANYGVQVGEENNKENNLEMEEVAKDELPEAFKGDIPVEAGAQVTFNFNTKNSDGRLDSSREFVSAYPESQNLDYYKKKLVENGWTIDRAYQEPNYKQSVIFAHKEGGSLNIRIYSTDDNKVKVSINVIRDKSE